MGMPGPRDIYNRLEKRATPIANHLTHSTEFARVVALLGDLDKSVRGRGDKLAARVWHLLNLPAGTDVARVRTQLGALDREVRLLSVELETKRARGVNVDGVATDPDGDDRPGTP